MTRCLLALFAAAGLVATRPVAAQHALPVVRWSAEPPAPHPDMAAFPQEMAHAARLQSPPARRTAMVLAGAAAAAVGSMAGLSFGAASGGAAGAWTGLILGPGLAVPVAVVAANGGRGAFVPITLASIGLSTAGLFGAAAVRNVTPLVLGQLANVAVATTLAHATSRPPP